MCIGLRANSLYHDESSCIRSVTDGGPPARTLLRDHESHRDTGPAIHKLPKTRRSLSGEVPDTRFDFLEDKTDLSSDVKSRSLSLHYH